MRVAVAGGSGTVGSSIVSALASSDNHIPVILTRATDEHPAGKTSSSDNGIEVRYVDYSSKENLVSMIGDIDAVISTHLILGPPSVTLETNLLRAAEEVKCSRFAPSSWALEKRVHPEVDVDHAKLQIWDVVRESVAKGTIDAGLFPCGAFMNYLGMGSPNAAEALAGLRESPHMFFLGDPKGPRINVPVQNGQLPSLTMTDIRDIGKFMVAALEMEEPWGGRELGMSGDTLRFTELISLCEKQLGKTVLVDQIEASQLDKLIEGLGPDEIIARLGYQYARTCALGGSVITKPLLNSLCPQVRPLSVKDYLEKYWPA